MSGSGSKGRQEEEAVTMRWYSHMLSPDICSLSGCCRRALTQLEAGCVDREFSDNVIIPSVSMRPLVAGFVSCSVVGDERLRETVDAEMGAEMGAETRESGW